MEQGQLPRYELVTSSHDIDIPISFVNDFICMCT